MTNAVGVDVGGTAIKAVLVDADGTVLADHSCATPRPDPAGRNTAAAIVGCVRYLAGGRRLPVGLTSPGLVDERRGVVIDSVNLNWNNVPIRDLVEELLGFPVGFGHDVRAGGLAEMSILGTGDPDSVTTFVAIGTGLAAAIFVGEKALIGNGWAGEIGQIRFLAGPHAGKRIEQVASASVLASRMGTSGSAEVAAMVAAGDPRAIEFWDDTAAALAFALAALTATIAPNVIIIGGGLAEAGELLFAPTRRWLEKILPDVPLPPIRPASHGHHAGAIGAALLGRRRVGSVQWSA